MREEKTPVFFVSFAKQPVDEFKGMERGIECKVDATFDIDSSL